MQDQPPAGIQSLRQWLAARLSGRQGSLDASLVTLLPGMAAAEGVVPLLLRSLREAGDSALPPAVMQRLLAAGRDSAARELLRSEETGRVLRALQEDGLEFLLLKGEALAHSLYPQPHLRTRSDVDILFAGREDAERAWSVLQSLGYRRGLTLQGRFVGFQFTCQRELSGGVEIQFDIHREICDFTWFARRLRFAEMRACAGTVPLHGLVVRIPGLSHALLHACLHRIVNKPHGTQDRLIWLYDIHLLCEALSGQWEEFVRLARDRDMAGVCLQGIDASRRYYGTRADLSGLEDAARAERAGLARVSTRRALYLLDWWHNPGVFNKLLQLREHLFPSSEYMQAKYGVSHKGSLPYHYLKRLFWGGLGRR